MRIRGQETELDTMRINTLTVCAYLYYPWHMRKPLVTLNLYLPSQEEKAEILAKAKERDKSVSEMVVSYFRKLHKKA